MLQGFVLSVSESVAAPTTFAAESPSTATRRSTRTENTLSTVTMTATSAVTGTFSRITAPAQICTKSFVSSMGLPPIPHWGSLQRSPGPPSWIKGSDVNKDLGPKAKAKAKDTGHKVKALGYQGQGQGQGLWSQGQGQGQGLGSQGQGLEMSKPITKTEGQS